MTPAEPERPRTDSHAPVRLFARPSLPGSSELSESFALADAACSVLASQQVSTAPELRALWSNTTRPHARSRSRHLASPSRRAAWLADLLQLSNQRPALCDPYLAGSPCARTNGLSSCSACSDPLISLAQPGSDSKL